MVDKVVPDIELDDAVAALVREIRACAPGAIAEIKSLYPRVAAAGIDAATRELTAATIARVRGGAEAREGFAAFLEKRPPRWARD